MATRVAGGSADRSLGRTWNALRPVAEWSARRWNRQPAGFAIGGVAPVSQAPPIVLIGSGERLTGVLAAGHKLPRRTCEGSEQVLLAVDQEVGGSSPPSCTSKINDLFHIAG
jgi:hypothetical protein